MWSNFPESGEQEVLVLEDDVRIGIALLGLLEARGNFPPPWELINFLTDTHSFPVGENIWNIYRVLVFQGWANRAACYLINRNGASRLLGHAFPIRYVADGLTGRATETGLISFGIWPPPVALSDVATPIEGREQLAGKRPSLSALLQHFVSSIFSRRI